MRGDLGAGPAFTRQITRLIQVRPRRDWSDNIAPEQEAPMSLTQIVLRLASSPGNPYGDDDEGYVLTAPLDDEGRLDVGAWRRRPESCTVVRFKPRGERHAEGLLTHRGANWFVHYSGRGEDEPIGQIGERLLTVGQQLTVEESDRRSVTYRVSEHHPPGCDPLELARAAAREASAEW